MIEFLNLCLFFAVKTLFVSDAAHVNRGYFSSKTQFLLGGTICRISGHFFKKLEIAFFPDVKSE